eukprot:CAMPEP_0113600236 /NCGR_PEP_ID=MMETSP0015_2-20120614/42597_1 /TAXON_ID=2838 /ORGANISM="Odontella" /LENGTH=260 /DNA_ID=CAMNT_0000508475 /DNA_START=88 /DNA_END=870 /DNA_ORIENTATION=+ /assembly_acc=CAM_ASM_000160
MPTSAKRKRPSSHVIIMVLLARCTAVNSYSVPTGDDTFSRRKILSQWGKATTAAASSAIISSTLTAAPLSAVAARSSGLTADEDIQILSDAADALGSLLENWDRATVDCTYADVPRELLEAKNKELLLEKASTFALFDKSVSVVSCKKSNRLVRDYIGATGKGPVVGAEKRMLRRSVADRVDPERLDDYYSGVEKFSQAISRASSLSYAAGVADFDSVNNFEKGKERETGDDTNLEQARRAVGEAKGSIDKVVGLLRSEV